MHPWVHISMGLMCNIKIRWTGDPNFFIAPGLMCSWSGTAFSPYFFSVLSLFQLIWQRMSASNKVHSNSSNIAAAAAAAKAAACIRWWRTVNPHSDNNYYVCSPYSYRTASTWDNGQSWFIYERMIALPVLNSSSLSFFITKLTYATNFKKIETSEIQMKKY